MDDRFRVLTGGTRDAPLRQRTLQATVDWSYELLDEGEKRLFARLGVFRGGRSLEAIEAVCSEGLSIEVYDGLAALVDKNMLRQIEDGLGEPRFVMLETIQEYALDRLAESGEAEVMRQRHAAYFADLCELAEPDLWNAQSDTWFKRLNIEWANLRAALAWSFHRGELTMGLRLVAALRDFCLFESHHIEGRYWVERAFQSMDDAPLILRGRVLLTASTLAYYRLDLQQAAVYGRDALAIFRQLDDEIGVAWALLAAGSALRGQPEKLREALAMLEEGLTIFRSLSGPERATASAFNYIGNLRRQLGDYAAAQAAYEEALALTRKLGSKRHTAVLHGNMGAVAFERGDYDLAETLQKEALRQLWNIDFKYFAPHVLASLAAVLSAQEQPLRALRLLGASVAACETMGVTLQPSFRLLEEHFVALLKDQLDAATYAAAWDAGHRLSLEEAVMYAIRDED